MSNDIQIFTLLTARKRETVLKVQLNSSTKSYKTKEALRLHNNKPLTHNFLLNSIEVFFISKLTIDSDNPKTSHRMDCVHRIQRGEID